MQATMMNMRSSRPAAARVGGARIPGRKAFAGKPLVQSVRVVTPSRARAVTVQAVRDGEKLDRKLRVAVIGGGPSGACAADDLAKGGVETFMFERKLDNCKVRPARIVAVCTNHSGRTDAHFASHQTAYLLHFTIMCSS